MSLSNKIVGCKIDSDLWFILWNHVQLKSYLFHALLYEQNPKPGKKDTELTFVLKFFDMAKNLSNITYSFLHLNLIDADSKELICEILVVDEDICIINIFSLRKKISLLLVISSDKYQEL